MTAATFDGDASKGQTDASVAARRPRLTRKRILLAVLLVGAAAGAGAYGRYWWQDGRFLVSTDDAYVGGDTTVIAPKVSGFVTEIAVVDNQRVKAGDLIVRIDPRDFKAALAGRAATLAAREAALANLESMRRLQEAVIAQSEAEVAASDAEVDRAQFDDSRYRTLSEKRYASDQRFEQANADYKKAVANARRARAAREAARRQIEVIDTQKRQAAAAIDQARADVDVARLNLGYTEIRAPIDGMIGNRSIRVGSYATAGAAMIALVPSDGLWVDANFKENQLAGMRAGQRVEVVADVAPDERFAGHLDSLSPATGAQFAILPPENATGNFTKIVQRVPVRIRLDGDGARLGRLRPGLSVTASVDLRTAAADRQPQPVAAR